MRLLFRLVLLAFALLLPAGCGGTSTEVPKDSAPPKDKLQSPSNPPPIPNPPKDKGPR
jgi:hypothetical protein